MTADQNYEAPAVAAVTPVETPLIGTVVGSVTNPQWNDEADIS